LMGRAGWRYRGVVPTSAPLHLVEGYLPD